MMTMMERKIFSAEVKAADEKALIVEHFISTESKDRVGDIVRAAGMKVRGKPVVLLGHGHEHMGSEPIAKPLSLKKGEFKGVKGILARTQFFPDEIGKRLFDKTIGGYMPNWSIGFIPLEATPMREKESDNPMQRGGRDITKWELLEYSLVGVPAQSDAQTVSNGGKVQYEMSVKFLSDDRKNEQEELLDGDGQTVQKDSVKEVEIETDEEEKAEEMSEEFSPADEKPYPNEHACRIVDPAKFEKMRRKNNAFGEGVHAIYGITGDGKSEVQALRFSKDKFTPAEARAWCKSHKYHCIEFEPASGAKEEVAEESAIPLGEESRLQSMEERIAKLAGLCDTFEASLETLSKSMAEKIDALVARLDPPGPVAEPAPAASTTPEKDAAPDNPPEPMKPRLVFVRAVPDPSAERRKRLMEDVAKEAARVAAVAMAEEINKLKGKVP